MLKKLRTGWKHAFDLESPHGPLTEKDRALMAKIARKVAKRRMCDPAVLFLESVRPLNYVGSQAMVFLGPFLSGLFNSADYDRMVAILDRREGLAALIEEIEKARDSGKDAPS